jgi:hypothetical protein
MKCMLLHYRWWLLAVFIYSLRDLWPLWGIGIPNIEDFDCHRCDRRRRHHHRNHLQKGPFWATDSLRRFCQACLFHHDLDHLVFTLLNFVIVIVLQNKMGSFASNPLTSVFMPSTDRAAQLYSREWGFLFNCLPQLTGLQWKHLHWNWSATKLRPLEWNFLHTRMFQFKALDNEKGS